MSLDLLFGIMQKGIVTPSELIYRRRVAKASAASKSPDSGQEREGEYDPAGDEVEAHESTYLSRIKKRFSRRKFSPPSGHVDEKV